LHKKKVKGVRKGERDKTNMSIRGKSNQCCSNQLFSCQAGQWTLSVQSTLLFFLQACLFSLSRETSLSDQGKRTCSLNSIVFSIKIQLGVYRSESRSKARVTQDMLYRFSLSCSGLKTKVFLSFVLNVLDNRVASKASNKRGQDNEEWSENGIVTVSPWYSFTNSTLESFFSSSLSLRFKS
jgi:hypothetical protein